MQLKLASLICLGIVAWLQPTAPSGTGLRPAALYLDDNRRAMLAEDYRLFPGAGVLFCRDDSGVFQKAAAAWLIGNRRLVMMNAHNFRDRSGESIRTIDQCNFYIAGRSYDFDGEVQFGIATNASGLHITDDWALARLHLAARPASLLNRFPTPRHW